MDMDDDCDVDVADIMLVAGRWNSYAGDPLYVERYDVDNDGDIDVLDIMLVAGHWGETCEGGVSEPEADTASVPGGNLRMSNQGASWVTAPGIRIEPPSSTAQPGSLLYVQVMVEDVLDLGGLDLTIAFDPAVLQVDGATLGSFLGSTGRAVFALGPLIDNGVGVLRFGGFSFGEQPGASGTGIVAQVSLLAQGEGVSGLTFSRVQLADTRGQAMQPVTITNGSVSVLGSPTATPTASPTPLVRRLYLPLLVRPDGSMVHTHPMSLLSVIAASS